MIARLSNLSPIGLAKGFDLSGQPQRRSCNDAIEMLNREKEARESCQPRARVLGVRGDRRRARSPGESVCLNPARQASGARHASKWQISRRFGSRMVQIYALVIVLADKD